MPTDTPEQVCKYEKKLIGVHIYIHVFVLSIYRGTKLWESYQVWPSLQQNTIKWVSDQVWPSIQQNTKKWVSDQLRPSHLKGQKIKRKKCIKVKNR